MPRFLALEWNDTEARVAVAASRGEQAVVEQAFTVSLLPSNPGEGQPPVDVGQRIATALAARGLGRMEALVSIGRTDVELRQLALPPAPDEELPDMVRFQAMREFNALDEDWPLDFLPIDDDPEQPRTVLAAAIAPQQVAQLTGVCQAAGLRPRRLVLRPCAAASLWWRRAGDGRMQVQLLVDLLGDEADLTVMIGRKVIFLRTARLPGDPLADPEGMQVLLAEIRRTMAAVQNQLAGRKVETIVLCGDGPPHAALADQIAERLTLATELFDPFANLELQGDAAAALPAHPGRFAPLLGMLCDEIQEAAHGLDFLHPRHRPAPPSKRNTYALAGLAAAIPVAALLFLFVWQFRSLGAERMRLEDELKSFEPNVVQATKDEKAAKEIEAWKAGDVVWLEELRRLSERSPSAREVILSQMEMRSLRQGGEMKLDGAARSVAAIASVQEALGGPQHRVSPKGGGENTTRAGYSMQFGSSVVIQPEKRP